jgi:hypothetical protein
VAWRKGVNGAEGGGTKEQNDYPLFAVQEQVQ